MSQRLNLINRGIHTVKFKMSCPNCNAAIITACPDAVIWELCPSCRRHVWDGYDAKMAEVAKGKQEKADVVMRIHTN